MYLPLLSRTKRLKSGLILACPMDDLECRDIAFDRLPTKFGGTFTLTDGPKGKSALTSPDKASGFTFDAIARHRNFRVLAHASTANKFIGDGWSYGVRSDFHFGRKVSFGGGIGFSQTRTSQWVKHSVRPYVGGGFLREEVGLLAHYVHKGTDESNSLHGVRVEGDVRLSNRFRLRQELGVYRFHSSGQPESERHTGVTLRTSLVVRLWQ